MPFLPLIVYARCLRTEKKDEEGIVPIYAIKGCSGVEIIAPLVCTLALDGGGWSASCPSSLTSRKQLQVPTEYEVFGSWNQFGHFGEERNVVSLLGFKPWIVQPVA